MVACHHISSFAHCTGRLEGLLRLAEVTWSKHSQLFCRLGLGNRFRWGLSSIVETL